MLNGFDDAVNAASAAGPLVLLTLAILALVGVVGVGIWKLTPIMDALANKIPRALENMERDVAQANRTSGANATAIGGLAEAISQLVLTINAVQEKHQDNQLQLSASQEKFANQFDRSVDVLSNMYDRMNMQSTQMDVIIGTTSATKKTADDTHTSVTQIQTAINNGVSELGKIVLLLNELKQQSEQQLKSSDLDRVAALIESTKSEMLQAIMVMSDSSVVIPQPDTSAVLSKAISEEVNT